MTGKACAVCSRLPAPQLIELNALLADPSGWPKNLLGDWGLPTKAMPARMREWGGIEMGLDAMRGLGLKVTRAQMAYHFTEHVTHVAKNDLEVMEVGRMGEAELPGVRPANPSASKTVTVVGTLPTIRPRMFIDYYAKGIQLGIYALDRLKARILEMEQNGEPVPEKMLWQLAELGSKLSMNQASLIARGQRPDQGDDDETGGFRAGAAPLPSERFGDSRIREIEGEKRPVIDRGPADRREYNERARQEGSPTLPV